MATYTATTQPLQPSTEKRVSKELIDNSFGVSELAVYSKKASPKLVLTCESVWLGLKIV